MLWKNLPNHNQDPNIVVNANGKKLKQLVPTEGFRLIMTMASVNIQGYYDISSVVSPLLLLCKVCSVQCVCVLFF